MAEANKLNKKVKRKLLKLSQKLPSTCTIAASDIPTVYILVGNGGLSYGISNELLLCILKQCDGTPHTDDVVDIYTAVNCDSPIVEFKDARVSKLVLNALNGQCVQDIIDSNNDLRPFTPDCIMADNHPPLHLLMAYVTEIPAAFCSNNKRSEILGQPMFPPGCHLLDNFISEEEEVLLLKHFSIDFKRIADSLRQCKDWEQSMRYKLKGQHDTEISEKQEDEGDNTTTITVHDMKEEEHSDDVSLAHCPSSSQLTHLKLRTVHHYGYEFLYDTNTVNPATPLPGGLPHVLDFLVERIMRTGLLAHAPDQLTVNEYEPGAGIPRHVDTHSAFKDGICVLTLGSHTLMQFQCNNDDGTTMKVDIVLPRMSLLIMKGESRYKWMHCIPARKSDIVASSTLGMESFQLGHHLNHLILQRFIRVSLTLRKIHCSPCDCDYPGLCDRQLSR